MTMLNKKRILVVDDIPYWRRLLAALLGEYELDILGSYKDAVIAIEQFQFDIAVLDLRLEDNNIFNIDGVDLLKKIKSNQPNTKIVILTGYRESVRDQILREYVPDEIFNKQVFDNNEFRATIRNLIQTGDKVNDQD